MFRFCSIPVDPQTCQQDSPLGRVGRSVDPLCGAQRYPAPGRIFLLGPAAGREENVPRVGGPICAEPLDDESPRDSRQSPIKPSLTIRSGRSGRSQGATRGTSLSRGLCKPQIESVKKKMGSDRFESNRESFARTAVRLLRARRCSLRKGARSSPPRAPRSDQPAGALRSRTPPASYAAAKRARPQPPAAPAAHRCRRGIWG